MNNSRTKGGFYSNKETTFLIKDISELLLVPESVVSTLYHMVEKKSGLVTKEI